MKRKNLKNLPKSKQPTTNGKKIKRTYKSVQSFKPYDSTHGFRLQKEFYADGYKRYTLSCLCCPDNMLEIHACPDKLYPTLEIGGILLGFETAERIFAEIFNIKTSCKKI